jgi:hypothetical protein
MASEFRFVGVRVRVNNLKLVFRHVQPRTFARSNVVVKRVLITLPAIQSQETIS